MKTSKQNNITSVSRNQNVLIRAVFQRAGDTRKVLNIAGQIDTSIWHVPPCPKSTNEEKSKSLLIHSDTTFTPSAPVQRRLQRPRAKSKFLL